MFSRALNPAAVREVEKNAGRGQGFDWTFRAEVPRVVTTRVKAEIPDGETGAPPSAAPLDRQALSSPPNTVKSLPHPPQFVDDWTSLDRHPYPTFAAMTQSDRMPPFA